MVGDRQRNSGIELFRCLLMFSICFQHAIVTDAIPTVGKRIFNLGVAGFAFLSGYYGVRFSVSKILRLWTLVALASLFLFAISGISPLAFFRSNWYVNAYTMLLLLSPLINEGLRGMVKNRLAGLMGVILMLLLSKAVESGAFSSCVPAIDGIGRLSFFRLFYIYVFAFLAREFGWLDRVSISHGCFLIAVGLLGMLVFGGTNSIFAMVCILVLFRWFERLRLNNVVGRMVLLAAPSMFAVYLLHTNFYVSGIMHRMVGRLTESGCPLWAAFFLVAGVVFVCALGIDVARRLVCWPLSTLLERINAGIDALANNAEEFVLVRLVPRKEGSKCG